MLSAAAAAVANGYISPRETAKEHIREVQKILPDDDCFLPGFVRQIPEKCKKAVLTASSGGAEVLRNGIDREKCGVFAFDAE